MEAERAESDPVYGKPLRVLLKVLPEHLQDRGVVGVDVEAFRTD
jgi:hypothetical protein